MMTAAPRRHGVLFPAVGIMLLLASREVGGGHTRVEQFAGFAIAAGALMVFAGALLAWRADRVAARDWPFRAAPQSFTRRSPRGSADIRA